MIFWWCFLLVLGFKLIIVQFLDPLLVLNTLWIQCSFLLVDYMLIFLSESVDIWTNFVFVFLCFEVEWGMLPSFYLFCSIQRSMKYLHMLLPICAKVTVSRVKVYLQEHDHLVSDIQYLRLLIFPKFALRFIDLYILLWQCYLSSYRFASNTDQT